MVKKKNNKKVNKKVSKNGAVKKTAPNKNYKNDSYDNDYIIGVSNKNTKNNNKLIPVKKQKNKKTKNKKVKKLTPNQIRKRKIIFKLIRWTCLLTCIIGAIIYIILSPIFAVKKISVNTDGNIDEQEIISLAAINLNENIFKFSKTQIINNIKENAYVDEVIIKRKLPSEVQITITERVPMFMIRYGNSYVYVNSQGYFLEISDEYKSLPILTGIQTEDEQIQPGNRLDNEDLQKLTTVLKIIEYSQNAELYELITTIDISNKNDYKIILDKEEKTIYLGDCSMLEERIIWAKNILDKEKGVAGEIFVNMQLDSENHPYFRERV